MPCDQRRLLENEVDSDAHNLRQRLKQREGPDLKFDLLDIKRMAQDLLDSLAQLREHEEKHKCNE